MSQAPATAPKPRTTAEIQQEYNNLAFKAGHLQYQIKQEQKSLDMINETLSNLAAEHVGVKVQEDRVAAAVAAETASKAAAGTPESPKEADASLAAPAEPPKKRGRGPNKPKPTEGTVQ